jgi:predicted TIM-barrel fold metal-dependent hydrolase
MAIDGMKVIDLDSHLVGDLDNWVQTIEPKYKEFLPRRLPTKDNERRRTLVGNRILVGSELGSQKAQKLEWVKPRDLTSEGRVQNMDLDGIDVAVLSPNSTALDMLWFPDDPELAAAYARAQNDYMNAYAAEQPGRLMWAGVIPLQDPKEAVKELERSRALGSQALNVKATPIAGKEWWDPYFDPIFDALEKTKTPIIFHDTKLGSMGQERFAENFFFSHMVGRTIESMICLMVYLCGGVMEKHPDLKIVCLETGASQMPWWLSRMDEHFEKLPHLVPWQKRRPSEIFNESVYVGCEPFEDSLFEWAIDYLGGDRLVLATDSPHWDSSKPGEVTGPVAKSTKISPENKRKVLGENAIRLLGLGL